MSNDHSKYDTLAGLSGRAGPYLALLDRVSSRGLALEPVPREPALVLLGCWCKTSSSLAVVASVSSLWTETVTV